MRSFTVDERRARLARRHFLNPEHRAHDVVDAATGLCGLHASDPATVFLSARARVENLTVSDVEQALYTERSLTKHLGMRRTLFALPHVLVPIVQAACTDTIAAGLRKRLIFDIETAGVAANGARWLASAERAVLNALDGAGLTGAQLSRRVPALRVKLTYAPEKSYGGEVGVATRVLTLMSAQGTIVRSAPNGSWTSSQHVWTRAEPSPNKVEPADAQRQLIAAWLHTYGPATIDDIAWWTGLGTTKVRAALTQLDTIEADLDGRPGRVLAGDDGPEAPVEPWAALLPSLDPTTMGWKHRTWYLGEHASRLFDRNGNAGPTVWWNGRVVGGWAQRTDGAVVWQALEKLGRDATRAIDAEAMRLQQWFGSTIAAPRFRTPLETELRSP